MLLHYLPWAFSETVTMAFPCVFGLNPFFIFSPAKVGTSGWSVWGCWRESGGGNSGFAHSAIHFCGLITVGDLLALQVGLEHGFLCPVCGAQCSLFPVCGDTLFSHQDP